ncbi:hypothetical protein [Actinomadura rubrisoli]|uniref:Uncharacterized protein n=1 Tax=Actinomadura rubrisoli TaxID=2530368 RepID=A0A4V6PEV2_9ACTN|nr:hypothetical protein [Actinomadura rubrisoli]TDD82207.1 hypothetical protein E1298_23060 [Actinomadura rubrisoli]
MQPVDGSDDGGPLTSGTGRHTRTAPVREQLAEVAETITYLDQDASEDVDEEPAHTPHRPLAREDLAAELADQIRVSPDSWRPDYTKLMARTGMGRRWCGCLVRDASARAAQPHAPVPHDPRARQL